MTKNIQPTLQLTDEEAKEPKDLAELSTILKARRTKVYDEISTVASEQKELSENRYKKALAQATADNPEVNISDMIRIAEEAASNLNGIEASLSAKLRIRKARLGSATTLPIYETIVMETKIECITELLSQTLPPPTAHIIAEWIVKQQSGETFAKHNFKGMAPGIYEWLFNYASGISTAEGHIASMDDLAHLAAKEWQRREMRCMTEYSNPATGLSEAEAEKITSIRIADLEVMFGTISEELGIRDQVRKYKTALEQATKGASRGSWASKAQKDPIQIS